MDLKNKTILVTGASSSIGQAAAIECAKKGAFVVIHYHKNLAGAEETLAEVKKYADGQVVQTDLMFPDNVAAMFKEINKPIDCLVNNAGDARAGDIFNNEMWAYQFANIFFSQIYCIQNFLKQNNEVQRKIINIASIYGKLNGGEAEYISYSAAKSAVLSVTMTLAKKYNNILINAVTPGYTWTREWERMNLSEDEKRACAEEMVCGRFLQPADIAGAIVEALEDDAKTGQIINSYQNISFELKK